MKGAEAEQPQDSVGQWFVSVDFNGSGGPQWRELTARRLRRAGCPARVAIVLDDEVISSPAVDRPIAASRLAGGCTQITGGFTPRRPRTSPC